MGWVVKWIFVSLTWVSSLFGVLLVLVVLVVLARGLHPVSFPNLEVKPFCADGTAAGRSWESRALPTVSLWWGCLVLFEGWRPHRFFVCVSSPHRFFCVCVVWFVFGGGCWTTPKIFLTCEVWAWGKGALTSVGRLKI